jgi:hypothetical protein
MHITKPISNGSFAINKYDEAVLKSLKKSIISFREHPYYYFTEADLQSYLQMDLLDGNSNLFYVNNKQYPAFLIIN